MTHVQVLLYVCMHFIISGMYEYSFSKQMFNSDKIFSNSPRSLTFCFYRMFSSILFANLWFSRQKHALLNGSKTKPHILKRWIYKVFFKVRANEILNLCCALWKRYINSHLQLFSFCISDTIRWPAIKWRAMKEEVDKMSPKRKCQLIENITAITLRPLGCEVTNRNFKINALTFLTGYVILNCFSLSWYTAYYYRTNITLALQPFILFAIGIPVSSVTPFSFNFAVGYSLNSVYYFL